HLLATRTVGDPDLEEGRLAGVLQLHEVDVVRPQLAQRRRAGPADSQPAHDRRRSEEELTLVGARPALGDVELQELAQEIDGEADPGAVEDRLPRPIENSHELRTVDPGNDGPELIARGRDVKAADFYKQHCSS